MEEFDKFLDETCVTPERVALFGDFNVHMDEPGKYDTKKLANILKNTGFHQHVVGPTHKSGHTLDLVISRPDDDLIRGQIQADNLHYSDHYVVPCTIQCEKPPPLRVTTTYREYGKMDHERLTMLLGERFTNFPDSEDPNLLVESYENLTSSVLDEVCPLVTKTRTVRSKLPWYNETIHEARRKRRRLERKWKKTRAEADETAFITQKDHVSRLITSAKIEYFTNKCTNATMKDMYSTINFLLNRSPSKLPDCTSYQVLADRFLSFFIDKVEKIRNNVNSVPSASDDTYISASNMHTRLSTFKQLTDHDVRKIIMKFSSKSCSLDSLPSWLVKENLQTLLPIITRIVNSSLATGSFPLKLKRSVITPVIKKPTMDQNSLKSYRPVANITFLSKIVEKAATCQVTNHVETNHLGEKYQSAYRRHHSTETALLKVKNDILQSLDNGKAIFMVLLDMSAAFDTVDHHILLQRLKCRFGIEGTVNRWFASYLCDRTTKVTIKNEVSRDHMLKYSLPQGSIVGPLGFILYTTPLEDIIRDHGIDFHKYADDIQLYLDFDPKIPGDYQRALTSLTSCISKITDWMVDNTLQLNQSKTEFIVIASNHVLPSLANVELRLGDVCIYPSKTARNLGVIIDAPLNMSEQINSLCRSIIFI